MGSKRDGRVGPVGVVISRWSGLPETDRLMFAVTVSPGLVLPAVIVRPYPIFCSAERKIPRVRSNALEPGSLLVIRSVMGTKTCLANCRRKGRLIGPILL
jgi:hypothetical protein